MRARAFLKGVLLATAAAVLLYSGIYIAAVHGDAFQFVESKIKHSPEIAARIGKVNRVRLDPLGLFETRYVGEDEQATMIVEVGGDKGSLELEVRAKKTNGAWAIEQTTSGGTKLVID